MSRPLPPKALKELGLRKGRVFAKMVDPILLYVARIRIAGKATRRHVPVQTWLGGDKWGKVRVIGARNFVGPNAWKPERTLSDRSAR